VRAAGGAASEEGEVDEKFRRMGGSGAHTVPRKNNRLQCHRRPGQLRFPLYNRDMTDKTHHVVPDPDGGWNVLKGGSDRASKHFEIQQAAIEWARKVSRTQKTELVIHRRDGTILQKDSQGHDPLPPRGHK